MARTLKWVTFGYELFISIPLVGGLYLFPNRWIPMLIALVLHVVAWIFMRKDGLPETGNLFGIGATIAGMFSSILFWIVHGTTVFLLLIELVAMHALREELGFSK